MHFRLVKHFVFLLFGKIKIFGIWSDQPSWRSLIYLQHTNYNHLELINYNHLELTYKPASLEGKTFLASGWGGHILHMKTHFGTHLQKKKWSIYMLVCILVTFTICNLPFPKIHARSGYVFYVCKKCHSPTYYLSDFLLNFQRLS